MPQGTCSSVDASPFVHFTLSCTKSSSLRVVERLPSPCARNQTYSPFESNLREPRQSFELDSLYNILHLILFGVAMRMAYEFWLRKFSATTTTTTLRAITPSRVARQQETSPDISVEVKPVPPLGLRIASDSPGNKGQAPLDLLQRDEPSHTRGSPMFSIQTGVSTETTEESSLLHMIFNHASTKRIMATLGATRGIASGTLVHPICDSCVVTKAQRHNLDTIGLPARSPDSLQVGTRLSTSQLDPAGRSSDSIDSPTVTNSLTDSPQIPERDQGLSV